MPTGFLGDYAASIWGPEPIFSHDFCSNEGIRGTMIVRRVHPNRPLYQRLTTALCRRIVHLLEAPASAAATAASGE